MNIEKLLEAGVHFGHRVTKWNPRMAPFIYGERNGIHILDVVQTMQFLEETSEFLEKFKNEPSSRTFAKQQPTKLAKQMGRKKISGRDFDENSKNSDSGKPGTASRLRKKDVLFVGTKKQASYLIEKAAHTINGLGVTVPAPHDMVADSSSNSKIVAHYVNHRWLGGLLTNWSTMKICIQQLNDLEKRNSAGEFENLPKKERSNLKKDYEKLMKFFGGIQHLKDIPDLVFIIGQDSEMNAVRECLKLQKMNPGVVKPRNPVPTLVEQTTNSSTGQNSGGVTAHEMGSFASDQGSFPPKIGPGLRTITLLDTNCDPELADLFIPANDDSAKSLTLFLDQFTKVLSE